MADVKISALTAAVAGNVLATTQMVIVDLTQNKTYHVALSVLRTGLFGSTVGFQPDPLLCQSGTITQGGHALALLSNGTASTWASIDAPATTRSAYIEFTVGAASNVTGAWQIGRGANDNSANFNIFNEHNQTLTTAEMEFQALAVGGCKQISLSQGTLGSSGSASVSVTTGPITTQASTTARAGLNLNVPITTQGFVGPMVHGDMFYTNFATGPHLKFDDQTGTVRIITVT